QPHSYNGQKLPLRPVYNVDDLHRLVGTMPYMSMRREEFGLRLLTRQAKMLEAWGDFLPRYRTIQCEPLDFAYQYLRCLGALDELVLQDLFFTEWYTWRGIVIGSLLAALDP